MKKNLVRIVAVLMIGGFLLIALGPVVALMNFQ